ncbi:MAG: class I SAM-dependent rRNA methyltransferase [Sandaracinaceae bacterium]
MGPNKPAAKHAAKEGATAGGERARGATKHGATKPGAAKHGATKHGAAKHGVTDPRGTHRERSARLGGGTTLRLAKDLARVLRRGHPWVFRDALSDAPPAPGTVVTVVDREGRFVGRGVAEAGPIGVRVWTTHDEPIDERFIERRVRAALALREKVAPEDTTALRLLHGEGDRLGGVVCDRYGAHGVLRLDGEATIAWREVLARTLVREAGLEGLLVKTGRRGETKIELAHGEVPEEIEVREHGMRLIVDPYHGQKTGLFLDHRESRRTVRTIARAQRVLNLYGYTGGFSIAAGLGGATEVTTVDTAAQALVYADRGWALNVLAPSAHRAVRRDVPEYLAEIAEEGARFDLIVSDPPSFAPKKDAVPRALRSYRALHEACFRVLEPDGLYLAASCSSHVGAAAFEETIGEAAQSAQVILTVLGRWGAAPDHPRLAAFPEGDYLGVVLCRVGR